MSKLTNLNSNTCENLQLFCLRYPHLYNLKKVGQVSMATYIQVKFHKYVKKKKKVINQHIYILQQITTIKCYGKCCKVIQLTLDTNNVGE